MATTRSRKKGPGGTALWRTAVSRLAALLLRALGASWRIRKEGSDPLDDPAQADAAQIGALWHRNILIAAYLFRDRDFGVSVSRSADGDWISAILDRLGYATPARGSNSHGGSGSLLSLVHSVRRGTTVAVLADGPRGPARRSKPGVVVLARNTGCAITPVALSSSAAWRFASWDGTLLPLPFARVVCAFGDPIPVPPGPGDEEETCRELDRALNDLCDRIDARLGLVD